MEDRNLINSNAELETPKNVISLPQILGMLKKHLRLIVGITLLCLLLDVLFTFVVIRPKYTSSTDLVVNQQSSKAAPDYEYQQIEADIQRINTYKSIIQSPLVKNKVKTILSDSPGIKSTTVNVTAQQNSQVFEISATSLNPNTASKAANTTANVFKQQVSKMLKVNNITVVSQAHPIYKQSSPHILVNLLAGLVFGIILGILCALLREMTDKSVRSVKYIKHTLGLNSLGTINELSSRDVKNSISKRDNMFRGHRYLSRFKFKDDEGNIHNEDVSREFPNGPNINNNSSIPTGSDNNINN